MVKGRFTYDNKTFRWRFKIYKCDISDGIRYGKAIILYKYNHYQLLQNKIILRNNPYNRLIKFYSEYTDEEIENMVKRVIIENYDRMTAKIRNEKRFS